MFLYINMVIIQYVSMVYIKALHKLLNQGTEELI